MSELPFIKMHGAGNDYVFVDGFETRLPEDPGGMARRVADRNRGIGSDGLVFLLPADDSTADVEMRMWNADGSEGTMCGNAARCVALWMNLQRYVNGDCRIATASRTVKATILQLDRDQKRGRFCVDLGAPRFDVDGDDKKERLPDIHPSGGVSDESFAIVSLSVGNPHAVLFVDELTDRLVKRTGSLIEKHVRFPGGTNVGWVRVREKHAIDLRVWERGSGETLACGSGACAAVAAAVQQGHCVRNDDIRVNLPGGQLIVRWTTSNELLLTGPAVVSFRGRLPC